MFRLIGYLYFVCSKRLICLWKFIDFFSIKMNERNMGEGVVVRWVHLERLILNLMGEDGRR